MLFSFFFTEKLKQTSAKIGILCVFATRQFERRKYKVT